MLSFFLFTKWRKENEREEEDEKVVIRISLLGSIASASHYLP